MSDMTPDSDHATTPEKADPVPRKLSREARRGQLIEATIEVLATRGYARTTLTEVATVAGLSHGLVNFHFQTKEKLLAETLQYLAEEYRENWLRALAKAEKDPASQLEAMLRADFHPAICTPTKLSAWCSFWGEAQSRPMYQDRCGSNDEDYIRHMEAICVALTREGGYSGTPTRSARVLRVTVEGVWLDMMTMTRPYGIEEAQGTVFACAAAFYPRHFSEAGRL
jgi:AcrR family transcriptional regulator